MSKQPARPGPNEPIRLVYTSSGAPRYRVTLDVSRKPRKQVTSTHDSLKAARDHVTQTRADITRGTYSAPVKTTFKDLAVEYLARVERGDHGRDPVRPATLTGYRHALARVFNAIGERPVADLDYDDIATMVDHMAITHSARSVALSLTLVRAVLTHGVRHRGLPRNVAEGVSPKGRSAVKRKAYTAKQLQDLSRAAVGDRLAGVWALLLLGLRRSEVLGVRWSDIDLDAGTLAVSRSRVWASGGFTDDDTKTERGTRKVALDSVTIDRLRTMRVLHVKERLNVGVGLTAEDVLAATEDGSPIRPEYLTTEWKRLCERADVPYLGLHAARHSQVKTLRAAGLPDGVIAARLGHNETVMRDTYGVPDDAQQQAAADVMARLLG